MVHNYLIYKKDKIAQKKISDLKLKWDHNLYSELNKAGNEAKESLNKSMLTARGDIISGRHFRIHWTGESCYFHM